MPHHDPIAFANCRYRDAYLNELVMLGLAALKKIKSLNEKTPLPDEGYVLIVNYEIHDLILGILSNAANIKKIIHPSPRKNNETLNAFNFRSERGEYMKELFKDINMSELMDVKVRNSLEHFDEHLDDFCLAYEKGKIKQVGFKGHNICVSHNELCKPELYPIRVYEIATKTYHNFEKKINIGKIENEIELIVQKLSKLVKTQGDEPSGVMYH